MFAKTAVLAFFAAFAAAQIHKPVGDVPTPNFNPIGRPLLEVVEAGKPFTITWTPTTSNTISLVLLKGPSGNVVPVETIAEGLKNTGSYEYSFPGSFGASSDATGYGIQIIDDVNGNYQYSTQFGISVPEGYSVSSKATPSETGYPTGKPTDSYPTSTANSTSGYPTVTKHTSSYVASTGYPVSNSSVILPSKSMTVPSSLKTTATPTGSEPTSTSTSPPESTGAASHLSGAMGLFAGVAAMVFML